MKLHLPITLLTALLGACVVLAIEIPDGYEQIDLWTPSYLDDYTTNTADDKNAFILWTDVAFTPTTNPTWTSSKPLVTGGNLIFTTAEGYEPVALSFIGGKSTAFEQPASLAFDTLSKLSVSDTATQYRVALNLDKSGKLHIRNVNDGIDGTADVEFFNNKLLSVRGSVISASGSDCDIDISFNGDVSIRNNTTSGSSINDTNRYGGAIYSEGSICFSNNGKVSLRDNSSTAECENNSYSTNYAYSYGGAVYSTNKLSIINNKEISISTNSSSGHGDFSYNYGGAIYSQDSLSIDNNGIVSINGNFTSSRASYYTSYSDGGAIYSTGDFSISNNEEVRISNNYTFSSASGKYSYDINSPAISRGGAIYSAGSLSICNNGDVSFSENYSFSKFTYNSTSTANGGAIYSEGSLGIVGNDSVTFEKNYEKVVEYSGKLAKEKYTYRLRSILMTPDSSGDNLVLAAKTGGHITFYDSVCMGYYSEASASFNADYQDADGVKQKAGGDIIFSGENTAEHLAEIKGAAATSSEISNSQTSVINNLITLYGGTLQVVDGAKLNGRGLTVAAGSGAKLLLRDGSMSHSSYGFTFNSGTTLELQGQNSITASKVTLGSGSALTVTVGENNLSKAALTLGGTDLTTSKLTVNLNRTDGLTSGMYKIINQSSASDFTTQSAWTAENVTVNGSGHANRATFGDLVWENGTLYYKVGRTIWGNGSGDRLWNTTSDNWTMNDRSYTYLDGMDVTFTDLGAGEVKLVGDVAPADIIVNNSEGNDYTFSAADGGGKLVGASGITKNGTGALTLNTANTHTGATVLNAGTLNVHHSTALGATASGSTATVTTLSGTTLSIDNNSHVVMAGENSIAGMVNVAAGSSLEMQNKGYAASASSIDGTLSFNGAAAGTTNAGSLTGSGTVRVTDSSVAFASQSKFTGNLSVQGTNAKLSITSGNYNAAGTLEANGNGATLNLGTNNVTIKADGQIKLASEVTEENRTAAKLTANNVTISKDATLTVKGTEYIPVEADGTIKNLTLAATYAPPVLNSNQVGIADISKLTFNSGSTFEGLYGNLGLNNGELTLAVPSSFADKIHLEVRFDGEYSKDAKLVLFTDAGKVNFIYNGETVTATGTQLLTLNAADYFDGAAINSNTKVVFESGTVYLTEFNKVIPEPTSATLSLLALAALAARRRRNK
ncbi:MAG: hypothetical protein E7031_04170 [Akkermansiaceae bacterium]|nr:hypothetical protein [Akkermansiaceae bacterium]